MITSQTAVLQHHLCSHGAELISDLLQLPRAVAEPSASYVLLVPHQMLKDDVPTLPSGLHRPIVATEMWVERCLYSKEMVNPAVHIANTPFEKHPIKGIL